MTVGLVTTNETSADATLEAVLPELDDSFSHCVGTKFGSEGFFSDQNCKLKAEAHSSWRSRSSIKLVAQLPKVFTICT